MLKPMEFQAGEERAFNIELDFYNRPDLPRAWSIVAHAKDGAVTVRHETIQDSDSWPYLESRNIVEKTIGDGRKNQAAFVRAKPA